MWQIVAGIVIFIGMMFSGGAVLVDPSNPEAVFALFMSMFLFIGIGYAICCFGSIASMIKVAGDAALETRR